MLITTTTVVLMLKTFINIHCCTIPSVAVSLSALHTYNSATFRMILWELSDNIKSFSISSEAGHSMESVIRNKAFWRCLIVYFDNILISWRRTPGLPFCFPPGCAHTAGSYTLKLKIEDEKKHQLTCASFSFDIGFGSSASAM
ncbi:hypothetical protein Acr_26g0009830 [Actinidia rufa]|uniref:Uncharacterized protein n=1 Tax=Actinidia rufa TaxID=165716 RepID=A0A7J0H3N6_9ERIC|nr:hypothetical protein Acr_26g0009830 [Actinidia rufa]